MTRMNGGLKRQCDGAQVRPRQLRVYARPAAILLIHLVGNLVLIHLVGNLVHDVGCGWLRAPSSGGRRAEAPRLLVRQLRHHGVRARREALLGPAPTQLALPPSEKGVRLTQKKQVSPCIPVGMRR